MSKSLFKYLIVTFLLEIVASVGNTATAQDTIRFVDDTYIYISCDTFPSGVIKGYVDPDGDLTDFFDGYIYFYFSPGDTLLIWGDFCSNGDGAYLYLYSDGWVWLPPGDTINVAGFSSPSIVHYGANTAPVADSFELHFECRPSNCANGIGLFFANNIGATSASLNWQPYDYWDNFLLSYNGHDTVLNMGYCELNNLARDSTYQCSVTSLTDTGTEGCTHFLTFTTEPCNAPVTRIATTDITHSSITVFWDGIDGQVYRITDGITTDTASAFSYTFAGYQPMTTHTFTVVSLADTCCSDCSGTVTATTQCYRARVSGNRLLIGNDTITLTADIADGYLWSTGDTTRSIQVS